jgi:hypothetical protein
MWSEEELAEKERRIDLIAGEKGSLRWFKHLRSTLSLPCDVTGIEDFRWEEPYVFGARSAAEYRRLRKTQPSYEDVFVLESIEKEAYSEWAMHGDDLGANVRRKSDGALFLLGLSELRTVDAAGPNWQLLDDYAYWFVNDR